MQKPILIEHHSNSLSTIKIYIKNMQFKRVDVNIRRAIVLKTVSFKLILVTKKKTNYLSQF